MKELYHLSHFLEFLCGLYFGGFALLSFIEDSALERFSSILDVRRKKVTTSQIVSAQYFQVNASTPNDGILKYGIYSFLWFIYAISERIISICFIIASFFVTKLGRAKQKDLLKRFFPSFFFTGCFCLFLILTTAFLQINPACSFAPTIDRFILYYAASSIVFQMWSLIGFPFLVNVLEYEHLTFLNISICLILSYLSVHYCNIEKDYLNLSNFLTDEKKSTLSLFLIIIALIPIIFIVALSLLTVIFWEISTIFYHFSVIVFERKTNIDQELKEIKD